MALFQRRDQMQVGFSRSQVTPDVQWESDGAELLRSVRGERGAWITPDKSMQRVVLAMMALAAPATAKAIRTHLVPVAQAAFDQWPDPTNAPRATGLSKSLLAMEITASPDGGTLVASIVNRAPYAIFIKSSGVHIVTELVFKPARLAAIPMAADVAKEIGG